jgi:Tfp pilus assembly protein PilF
MRIRFLAILAVTAGCTPLARSLNEQGVAAFNRGDLPAAKAAFEQAIEHDYAWSDSYYNLGAVLHRENQNELAEWYYEQCLKRTPDHAKCRRSLSVLLVEQGRQAEAYATIQQWQLQSPGHADTWVELAWLEQQVGSPDRARQYLEQALELEPQHPGALAELAAVYETNRQPDRAAALYVRSLQADPKQPEVAQKLATLRTERTADTVSSARSSSDSRPIQTARDLRHPY